MSDNELLAAYADANDEAAFLLLMERTSGLVYSSALRRTASPDFAEEVLQNVFVALARKAEKLKSHPAISGWLYRATMYESAKVLSKESKRKKKMRDYQTHQETAAAAVSFDESVPTLDHAIDKLPAADRDLILLRFFEHKSYREIAGRIGKTEAASRKQAERALGKLGTVLRRQGIVASAAVLGGALSAQLTKAAPLGLVSSASKNVLTTVSAAAAPGTLTLPIMALTNSKLALATCTALLLAITGTAFWAGRERALAAGERGGIELESLSPSVAGDLPAGPGQNTEALTPQQLLRLLTHADQDLHHWGFDSTAGYQAELRLRQIPTDQLAEALRMVATEMPGGLAEHLSLAQYLMQFWAEQAGDEAMAFAYENLSPKDLKHSVGRILKPWADHGAAATLAWYRKTYDSDVASGILSHAEKEKQLRMIFGAWSAADALAAIAEYRRISSEDERSHAVHGIVNGMVNESHRAEVLAFITELTESNLRIESIYRAASVAGISEPAEAVALFESANLTRADKNLAAQGIYESWLLGVDPEAAADWFVAQSLSDEKLGARLGHISSRWGDRNPEALNQWLSQFELGAEMDSTVVGISHSFSMMGRRMFALEWGLKIIDPKEQAFALQNPLNHWAKEDPASALQWFQNAGLSTEVADAVQGMVTWNTP